jgi:DNA polymerase III subunit gamma/tau
MSNLVLYRKYRPLSFEQVVNQEHIKSTLRNAVVNNRIGHAYLFTGPRGLGKTTLARIFARAVNCPNVNGGEPCNACDICKEFLGNTSLDIMEIDAASNTGVDNIRELIEHLQFAPTRAKYKVIIVDEVHMLSKGAFNALLKTLEEPPKHAIFILATTEIHKVPATIISRSQRFDFKKASIADLSKLLKFVANDNNVEINDESLISIATAADGGFRDALSLLDQVINYTSGKITEDLVEQVLGLTGLKTVSGFLGMLIDNDTKLAVNFISELMYSGKDLLQFQKDFLEYLRKVLLVKTGSLTDFGFTEDMQKVIADQANKISQEKLMQVIELFQKAGNDLKWAQVPSLPLELAAVAATSEKAAVQRVSSERSSETQLASVSGENDAETLGLVVQNWAKIMDKIKDYNHSLIPSLKLSQPAAVINNELVLLFPYKFHKDAVEARKNRIVVDQVVEEILGKKLMVKPMLVKDWTGPLPEQIAESAASEGGDATDNSLMESALKIMGGEVESK